MLSIFPLFPVRPAQETFRDQINKLNNYYCIY
jgi:hypothetical protein